MARHFADLTPTTLLRMAALLLACATASLYAQAPRSSAEVNAPQPATTQVQPGIEPISTPPGGTLPDSPGPNPDPWSSLFTVAPSSTFSVSRRTQFRMSNPPNLFVTEDVGLGQHRTGVSDKRQRFAAGPAQSNALTAPRGNMTGRNAYPRLGGLVPLSAAPHGMFFATQGSMLNNIGIYSTNGSGISFFPSGGASFPAFGGQRRGGNTPLVSLKLKF